MTMLSICKSQVLRTQRAICMIVLEPQRNSCSCMGLALTVSIRLLSFQSYSGVHCQLGHQLYWTLDICDNTRCIFNFWFWTLLLLGLYVLLLYLFWTWIMDISYACWLCMRPMTYPQFLYKDKNKKQKSFFLILDFLGFLFLFLKLEHSQQLVLKKISFQHFKKLVYLFLPTHFFFLKKF